MSKEIKQRLTLNAPPSAVYDALMSSQSHAAFTGDKARISKKVGGKFSAYGPYIQGVNVELIEGARIVQAWRGKNWDEGEYSIATFALAPAPGNNTKLVFTQTGVPNKHHKSISQGWKDMYWTKLKSYLKTGVAVAPVAKASGAKASSAKAPKGRAGASKRVVKKAAAKSAGAKRPVAAKRAAAKKSPAKLAPKAAVKAKAPAKRPAAKRPAAKRSPASKKPAIKKPAIKKS
jgi:uncharacterized protein YndB with AHSA1/START domain